MNGYAATVGGGGGLDPFSTLSGNKASASWTVVAGGVGNTALGLYATIGGGYGNTVKTEGSSVLGGKWHLVTGCVVHPCPSATAWLLAHVACINSALCLLTGVLPVLPGANPCVVWQVFWRDRRWVVEHGAV